MAKDDTSGRFTVAARAASFRHAFSGLWLMLQTQHNAWIHLAATLIAIAAGVALHVSLADWRWLLAAMALVWTAEAMNTAFEHLCDVVQPDFHESVKLAKDVAAGAVLICAAAAAMIGAATLWPYLRK